MIRKAHPLAKAAVKKLPPDPDGQNDDRAEWAAQSLDAFQAATGTDLCDAVPDLLCDLMHWCDRNNTNFNQMLDRAQRHYQAETTGE